MQSLNIDRPGMPDLQFVLMVLALCTSGLKTLNVPESLRATLFDRCWALIHEGPPPTNPEERILDLRTGTDLTLDAMADQAGMSRRYGGIHFESGDQQGRALGALTGLDAWQTAQTYFPPA